MEAGKSCGGAEPGAPYANVAKLCHTPRTFAAPNVDHVATCT